jgi:hypothetical protein
MKSKINNFLLPLFFLTLSVTANTHVANAQNTTTAENTTVSPETQNQIPAPQETPELPKKKETAPPKKQEPTTKPAENLSPPQHIEEKPQASPPAEQSEENKQPDAENKSIEPQINKPTAPSESKPEIPKGPDLPEVSAAEAEEISSPVLELPPKDNKNIIKTIISWILICTGLLIVVKVIISNVRIPKNYEPHIKNKHGFKSGKRKSKYIKYK